ncbi:hypothetical protein [Pseudomonas huanghezhanensis]|uniref:hypothetical protein n=1 Tax=Pseudomonas huanghezhanensis TaxID=3002903 RepID=UPI0022866CA1|nr:hypothetical protein [Pseudomonas sp. BSw22131]
MNTETEDSTPYTRLDQIKLHKSIRAILDRLLRSLEGASTREEVESEGEMQISYIHELESDKRVRKGDIETLYIIFDDAVQARLEGFAPAA